jgi:polysaccharide biosynthesis/export protein
MPSFPPAVSRASLALALTLGALVTPPAARAQAPSFSGMEALSLQERQVLMAQQARRQALEHAAGTLTLEGAVDPDAYVVGPGDVFTVAVGGALATETQAQVSADGVLVLPEVGSFPVAGLSLTETRAQVRTGLRRVYRNVSSDIVLARPRQFFVHVSGAVSQPGRHALGPIARVEDAVASAAGGSPLGDADAALRNVEVRHQDGSRTSLDLRRYYATGEIEHNPLLRDGDAIYVPTVRAHEVVTVEFLLHGTPLVLDYRPGDTLTAVLLAAGGSAVLSQYPSARLVRTSASAALSTRDVDLVAVTSGQAEDPRLEPRDRILLPEPARRFGTATVEGYVLLPGSYPIEDDVTTLRDLVAAAGGIASEGLLRGAYLERRGVERGDVAEFGREHLQDPVRRTLILEQTSFDTARLSDLSFGSRQYLAREALGFQRVSLAFGDDAESIPPIPLRKGDRFVVPRDPRAVLVIGQVRSPGYVPIQPGASAEHYIAEAGGRGPAATRTYVREAGSGALRPTNGASLRSGDTVFVDREVIADTESLQALSLQEQQMEFQRQQDARTARVQIAQIGLTAISTAVAIVTTYLVIRER